MSNLLFNIRFGSYHWQLTRDWKFDVFHNEIHDKRTREFKWFVIYCLFGKHL